MAISEETATKISFIDRPWPIPLQDLPTPVLTLDQRHLDHNIATMAAWCAEAGVDLAPHGKTTMAPDIWRQQIEAGAWGLTVATAYQAQIARAAGIERIVFAGTTFSPDALEQLVEPGAQVMMWLDSLEGVRIVEAALASRGVARRLAVLVELGAPGGRSGARTIAEAVEVAAAVRRSEHLVLAGVAGYEGALTHGIDEAALQRVDDYLAHLIEFRDLLDGESFAEWLDLGGDVVVTAGGSVYFDRVVEQLGFRHDPEGRRGVRTRVVLRSGSYVTHDHDLYRRLTPFERMPRSTRFLPALDLWASVVSRPEPTLALLNVGRRDTADDEGYPVLVDAYRLSGPTPVRIEADIAGAQVTALNDQHAFVELPADSSLCVGDLVRLGISHPCTTIDKWKRIAAIDDGLGAPSTLPLVTGDVVTRF